jgi:hypothetical protein
MSVALPHSTVDPRGRFKGGLKPPYLPKINEYPPKLSSFLGRKNKKYRGGRRREEI